MVNFSWKFVAVFWMTMDVEGFFGDIFDGQTHTTRVE